MWLNVVKPWRIKDKLILTWNLNCCVNIVMIPVVEINAHVEGNWYSLVHFACMCCIYCCLIWPYFTVSDYSCSHFYEWTDSILFPDVPIALRLSSHLLLGVVRIYSRKVNYLFDDCSEALLKVKQAFRSTAVDLPPEESTAPYHSITLPETFDLDDFELPDNDIFQGLVPKYLIIWPLRSSCFLLR